MEKENLDVQEGLREGLWSLKQEDGGPSEGIWEKPGLRLTQVSEGAGRPGAPQPGGLTGDLGRREAGAVGGQLEEKYPSGAWV